MSSPKPTTGVPSQSDKQEDDAVVAAANGSKEEIEAEPFPYKRTDRTTFPLRRYHWQ